MQSQPPSRQWRDLQPHLQRQHQHPHRHRRQHQNQHQRQVHSRQSHGHAVRLAGRIPLRPQSRSSAAVHRTLLDRVVCSAPRAANHLTRRFDLLLPRQQHHPGRRTEWAVRFRADRGGLHWSRQISNSSICCGVAVAEDEDRRSKIEAGSSDINFTEAEKASQVVDASASPVLNPSNSRPLLREGGSQALPNAQRQHLVVRELLPHEYWEAADLHCAAFFPLAPWPFSLFLRIDRVSELLENLATPSGVRKVCLVAVLEQEEDEEEDEFEWAQALQSLPLQQQKQQLRLQQDEDKQEQQQQQQQEQQGKEEMKRKQDASVQSPRWEANRPSVRGTDRLVWQMTEQVPRGGGEEGDVDKNPAAMGRPTAMGDGLLDFNSEAGYSGTPQRISSGWNRGNNERDMVVAAGAGVVGRELRSGREGAPDDGIWKKEGVDERVAILRQQGEQGQVLRRKRRKARKRASGKDKGGGLGGLVALRQLPRLLRPLVALLLIGLPSASILGQRSMKQLNVGPAGLVGAVTIDNAAEYLPRRRVPSSRSGIKRKGIAYVANMAVRGSWRRRGVAKLLLSEAEALAREWGCRSGALHCNVNSEGTRSLYEGSGYRMIAPPEGALWPKPLAAEGQNLQLFMKSLHLQDP